jgi:phage replication O-like protein O
LHGDWRYQQQHDEAGFLRPSAASRLGMTDHEIEPPKYTQIPNVFLDEIMSQKNMGLSELKVTLAIFRQTFGWHKREDRISLTQLCTLTGLSRQAVIDGIEAAMHRKTIKRRPQGQHFIYAVNFRETPQATSQQNGLVLVNGLDQSSLKLVNDLDQTSQRFRPELVNDLDTQKKGKKLTKEREGRASASQDAPAPQRSTNRGTRLTIDTLPDDWRSYCTEQRPDLDPDRVWENFRDYWTAQAGQRAVKTDWAATWRTWVRREDVKNAPRHNGKPNGTTRPLTAQERINLNTAIDEAQARRQWERHAELQRILNGGVYDSRIATL